MYVNSCCIIFTLSFSIGGLEPLDQRVKPADGGGGLWGNGFKKTQPSTAQIMPKLRQILRQLAFKTHVFSGGWVVKA
jgi:hypothetical protein